MEYYKLRKSGEDKDYIISIEDYKKMLQIISDNNTKTNLSIGQFPDTTPGIQDRNNHIDYFVSIYNIGYDQIYPNSTAVKGKFYTVVNLKDLLAIKSTVVFDKINKINKTTKKKQEKDCALIVGHISQLNMRTF